MEINLHETPLEQVDAEALIVPVFEGRKETRFGATDLADAGEIAGKPLEMTLLHHVPGMAARRVLLAGAGKSEKFTSAEQRKLVAAAVRYLKPKSVKKVAFALDPEHTGHDYASAAVEGAILGDYEPDRLKTTDEKKSLESFSVIAPAAGASFGTRASQESVRRGRILAESQNFARDLANQPANLLPPSRMAEAAAAMASEQGLECEVLDRAAMEKLGMGALLGVAQGSAEPPALIVIRYRPENAAVSSPSRTGGKRGHIRYRRHLHQALRGHGENEVRHVRRRCHDRRHAGHRPAEARHRASPPSFPASRTCRAAARNGRAIL